MNDDESIKMTDLDYLTAAPHLQMIKAALPYVHVPEQRFFSILVKISELERTIQLFHTPEEGMVGICSLEDDAPASPLDMLNAMKPYGTEAEQEFIDLIINFLQGTKLYEAYREAADSGDFQDGYEQLDSQIPKEIPAPEYSGQSVPDSNRPNQKSMNQQHTGQRQSKQQQSSQQQPNQQQPNQHQSGQRQSGRQQSSGNGRNSNFSERSNYQSRNGNSSQNQMNRRFPLEQFKNMLPPDQQSRIETAQMLMQTFQQFS